MPKANQVAAELRKLADALDKGGEQKIDDPLITFRCATKEEFLTLARVFPKPIFKAVDDDEMEIGNRPVLPNGKVDYLVNLTIWFRAFINRNKVCTLIEPAKPAVYDCVPLLSDEELSNAVGAQEGGAE